MKRTLLFCLVVLLLLSLCSCGDKVIKDENGNVIERTVYKDDGSILMIQKYEYDDVGNCTQYKEIDDENNVVWIFQYEYDTNNRKVKSTHYEKGEIVDYTIFEYWDNGNDYKRTTYYANHVIKEIWEYDNDGNSKLWVEYDTNGEFNGKVEFTYSAGKLVRRVEYDKNGNITEEKEY